MSHVLSKEFYLRKTRTVARDLLGKLLVHRVKGVRLSGLITETEAYLGIEDSAAHTFGGRRTSRNEVMWNEAGHAYVYFIYGMHFCLNAVTQKSGVPEAVLIRGLWCTENLETIRKNRGVLKSKNQIEKSKKNFSLGNFLFQSTDQSLANGPGKLCQALGITKELNGVSLFDPQSVLTIENVQSDLTIRSSQIVTGPRIGIDYAGEAKYWPLRFQLKVDKILS